MHQWRKLAVLPSIRAASICAPICSSGLMMRPIGLRDRDSSPKIRLSNGCAASNPDIMRMVEPELPASRSCRGLLPAIESAALNRDRRSLLLDLNSQRAHAAERRMAIRSSRIIGDLRRAFRQRGDHRVAVGNRFVARQCDQAGQAPRGANSLSHEAPL